MTMHDLTDEQVEGENAAKRVKVSAEGLIVTPGYEKENAMIRLRLQEAEGNARAKKGSKKSR